MTFPYLHPVSFISAALLVAVGRVLYRRSADQQIMALYTVGCGGAFAVLMAVPVVFSVAALYTDPGRNGVINVLLAQITTLPLYLAALIATDGSGTRRERLARPLSGYRPARLVREGPAARTRPNRPWSAALLLCVLMCAVFGVRFGEHLRARTLVADQAGNVGPVTVLNAEGAQVGRIPSAGLLRPGESVCPSISVTFTAPDGTRIPLQIETNSGDTLPSWSAGNIIENSWVCDLYANEPLTARLPDALRATWMGATPPSGN
ncbi:hypothetical protein DEIGR_200006 [Deinococcus grandis]|uniref:Uncharacterized protein n=1 Tax=Deinococcus grandis TaxID=57498 RepID=A0A100HLV9_9DEIO|nr:hypothetical protein [Deinococcus grandis]BBN96540.1 hypothetical protein DEGR_32730 [Deinococcus grandis]GAQ23151.1 hypothetical protein DEIGR_200006 [Deinococcus grandis]